MRYGLALEKLDTGSWMAWNLDLPGCTSFGRTEEQAITTAAPRIAEHLSWLAAHGDGGLGPLFTSTIEINVEEVFRSHNGDGGGNSVAFFEADRMPLKANEVEEGLRLLSFSRKDLMALVGRLPLDALEQPIEIERFESIANILEHLAWAEWWYCDRLGMTLEREQIPENPVAQLDVIRSWMRSRLRETAGQRIVVEQVGEVWSPRKLLRRALWHEIDHTAHIARLLRGENAPTASPVEL